MTGIVPFFATAFETLLMAVHAANTETTNKTPGTQVGITQAHCGCVTYGFHNGVVVENM